MTSCDTFLHFGLKLYSCLHVVFLSVTSPLELKFLKSCCPFVHRYPVYKCLLCWLGGRHGRQAQDCMRCCATSFPKEICILHFRVKRSWLISSNPMFPNLEDEIYLVLFGQLNLNSFLGLGSIRKYIPMSSVDITGERNLEVYSGWRLFAGLHIPGPPRVLLSSA